MLITGPLFMADVIFEKFNITVSNTYGFSSSGNYIFHIFQWFTFLLILFIVQFKPYRISYFSPIYVILLSLYWVYFTNEYTDKTYFNVYVLGVTLALLLGLKVLSKIYDQNKQEDLEKSSKLKMLESFFDLTVLRIKKDK